MSIKARMWVQENTSFNGNELNVLMTIADCINKSTGSAYPSYQTIADLAHLTPRHVMRIVEKLANTGVLLVNKSKGRMSNTYSLNMSKTPDSLPKITRCENCHCSLNPSVNSDNNDDTTPVCAEVFPENQMNTEPLRSEEKRYDNRNCHMANAGVQSETSPYSKYDDDCPYLHKLFPYAAKAEMPSEPNTTTAIEADCFEDDGAEFHPTRGYTSCEEDRIASECKSLNYTATGDTIEDCDLGRQLREYQESLDKQAQPSTTIPSKEAHEPVDDSVQSLFAALPGEALKSTETVESTPIGGVTPESGKKPRKTQRSAKEGVKPKVAKSPKAGSFAVRMFCAAFSKKYTCRVCNGSGKIVKLYEPEVVANDSYFATNCESTLEDFTACEACKGKGHMGCVMPPQNARLLTALAASLMEQMGDTEGEEAMQRAIDNYFATDDIRLYNAMYPPAWMENRINVYLNGVGETYGANGSWNSGGNGNRTGKLEPGSIVGASLADMARREAELMSPEVAAMYERG
jgi:hypothetical protein